jgi:hypothetical protein
VNKKITVLTLLLSCSLLSYTGVVQAKAVEKKSSRDIEAFLTFSTNLKVSDGFKLRITGKDVFIDGAKLPEQNIIMAREAITVVLSGSQRDIAPGCTAGKYRHTVRNKSKKFEEVGCLTEKRFATLRVAFEQLKKLSVAQ